MRHRIALSMVGLLVSLQALAVEPARLEVSGAGLATCATFTSMMAENQPGTPELFETWAQGFIGGMNVEKVASRSLMEQAHTPIAPAMIAYMQGYCDKHPAAPFWRGVAELADSQ